MKKLQDEWDADDEEDEDWHEDTFEWKEKMKKPFHFDPDNPTESLRNYQPSGMQMCFCKLKNNYTFTKKEVEELGARWSAMMKTDGLDGKAYAIDEKTLLFTEDNGRIFELKFFVLQQPEVYKFTHNSQDFYPVGVEPGSMDDPKPEPKKRKKPKPAKTDDDDEEGKKKKKKRKGKKKGKKGKKESAGSAEL